MKKNNRCGRKVDIGTGTTMHPSFGNNLSSHHRNVCGNENDIKMPGKSRKSLYTKSYTKKTFAKMAFYVFFRRVSNHETFV